MAKGVRFRDTCAQFDKIVADITAGRFAPVYLLMGDEGYFIDAVTDLVAERALPEADRAFSQIVIYGKDTDEGQIVNFARQMPMMGSREVIIVKEAGSLKKLDTLGFYTSSPLKSTVLVIAAKGKSVDKRTQFYKSTLQNGVVLESVRPYDSEIGPWLADYIKQQKKRTIEPKALTMLTDYLGTDITKIVNELDKLMVRLPQNDARITAQNIEENIGISKDYNNFELLEAVAKRDFAKAMRIADHFARNPKNNPLVVTTITLFNYFQKLFILNYKEWESKRRATAMPSDSELAATIKVNPFLLGGYKTAARLYPNRKIFTIFGLLRQTDLKSKGMGGGGTDDGELLRELLLKIFMI
ncbi:MAG: DNA polymerase III subunit delta [Tidjanibacter sp.]|nr:DNA polymerase III subunit delta [Tidjanibacter sp.]